MNEVSIIMAIIGFILGSIQYQKRINLQNTRESMYRVIEHYDGWGKGMSIYKILEEMRKRITTTDKGNEEYKRCVKEWDDTYQSLHFWGIIFPLICLFLYVIYKIILFLSLAGF